MRKYRFAVGIVVVALASAVGCNKSTNEGGAAASSTAIEAPGSKLDKETAKKLLMANTYEKGVGYCVWKQPDRTSERGLTFREFDDTEAKCADQLEKAGLV